MTSRRLVMPSKSSPSTTGRWRIRFVSINQMSSKTSSPGAHATIGLVARSSTRLSGKSEPNSSNPLAMSRSDIMPDSFSLESSTKTAPILYAPILWAAWRTESADPTVTAVFLLGSNCLASMIFVPTLLLKHWQVELSDTNLAQGRPASGQRVPTTDPTGEAPPSADPAEATLGALSGLLTGLAKPQPQCASASTPEPAAAPRVPPRVAGWGSGPEPNKLETL